MDQKENVVRLSREWKLFQLYSLQIALGCFSGFLLLNVPQVESAFIKAKLVPLYAYFMVFMIFICILGFACSGGIGLFRLISAKRLIKLIEKEEDGV